MTSGCFQYNAPRLVQLITTEGPFEGGIDDTFVPFQTCNQLAAAPVEEFHIGRGAVLPFGRDPDNDLGTALGERVLKLAVASGKRGQRTGAEPFVTPQDHELKGAVYRQRVGEPDVSERLFDPGGRNRRSFYQGGNTLVRTAADLFNTVQVGNVKEASLIVDGTVGVAIGGGGQS